MKRGCSYFYGSQVLIMKHFITLTLLIILTSCVKPFRYPPFDETSIEMISEYNFVLVKNVMVKNEMTESKAEQYLLKSIMQDVITVCQSEEKIDYVSHKFGGGINMAHGYTPEELKRRNFEIGIFSSITTTVKCGE